MKLTFNSVVIGDDAPATGSRRTITINSIGGVATVQKEALAGGANPFQKARGNVSGQLVLTVANTFASVDLCNEFIVEEYARINTQASLVWERAATLFTFSNAILSGVSCNLMGVTVFVQYTFEITTITT